MKLKTLFAAILLATAPALPGMAQEPAVDFEDLMDSAFDPDTGTLSLGSYDLAFPPEGQVALQVGVIDPTGDLVGHYPATEVPGLRRDGLMTVEVRQPANVRLGKLGTHAVVFQYGKQPITRFQFVLRENREGGTSFGPNERFVLDGHWRSLAHITRRDLDGRQVPAFTFWLGGYDLPRNNQGEGTFWVRLYRNGQLVAQSKRTAGLFFAGHFKRREAVLFSSDNRYGVGDAPLFSMDDLRIDGNYEVRINRVPDLTQIRRFRFAVSGGSIQPVERARPDYEPAMNRILPWVTRGDPGSERLIEAIWIGAK